MKDFFKISAIFFLLTLIIPTLGFLNRDKSEAAEEIETEYEALSEDDDDIFKVLDIESGQVMEMSMYEYVKGAVFGEMPASYEKEALKAQAVAAHTYAVRRMEQQLEDPDPELMGAYISNDSSKYQAYFTAEQAEAFYGDDYEGYNAKISEAVGEVIEEIITYNGEPIVAAFHAVSGGKTESAEIVWGSAIDYLVPADSSEDESAPSYLEEKEFSADEIYARLTSSAYDITLPEEKDKWLETLETSRSGTVVKISAGDKLLSGTDIRSLLNLKSAYFDFEYDSKTDTFTFTTKGSGHGVGLSQYGANVMAENGSDYKEILLHYYTGVEIADRREE